MRLPDVRQNKGGTADFRPLYRKLCRGLFILRESYMDSIRPAEIKLKVNTCKGKGVRNERTGENIQPVGN